MLFADFKITILVVSAVALIGLAIMIMLMNRRNQSNSLFGVWLMFVASWSLTLAFYLTAGSTSLAELWVKACYSSALICISVFFYFSLYFIYRYPFNRSILVIDALCTILLAIVIVTTSFQVHGVSGAPGDFVTSLRPIGWYVYAMFLIVHFLAAHLVLLLKYLQTRGAEQLQLKYVLISVFIGGEVFGVLFNLILPSPIFMNWDYVWLGPTASASFIAPTIAYAILRKKLFNTRGLISEIVVFYTIILIVVDAMLSETISELLLRSLLAASVITLGVVLIKNIRAEDRQKRELERLTGELARANRKLEKRDQMRGEFISIASHQLRTPVSVMKGYLSLMIDGTYGRVSKKILTRLKQMYEMNERLVLLINNMLNMARIEKNRIDFGFKELDIVEVAADVVAEMSYKAEQKGLELRLKPVRNEMPWIVSDEEKLREILVNLIDNAIKYTQSGHVEISFSLDRKGEKVIVHVSDTGSGINEENAAKVFEKFYRIHNPNVPKESGTGLGLFIVTRFLNGMGGRIWIEKTEPGVGTTFSFELPFRPPDRHRAGTRDKR